MSPHYHEDIPFFNALPEPAIRVAARLWSTIQKADYNPVIAYDDFAMDLRALRIEPPSRAIVKRWQAGVQAGTIERPGSGADLSACTYFDTVHDAGLPALQEAWDRADAGADARENFDSLVFDFGHLGIAGPSWKEFVGWAVAVGRRQVERPAKQLATITEAVDEAASPSVPSAPAIDAQVASDLKAIRDRMVADAIEHLASDLPRYAARMVASQLRALADEMTAA